MKRVILALSLTLGIFSSLLLSAFFFYLHVTKGVALDPGKLSLSSSRVQIYDGNGNEVPVSSQKSIVGIEEMPDYLPRAFVAVEDKRFYEHGGFDTRRIVKAAMKNAASFSFREGASTISQQLIKNTHLTSEKTIERKLKEFKLTRTLERRYSKDEILSLYLNSIYFGHSAFGVGEAARFYFGASADKLSPAQSAMLAGLVKAPNSYSPFRNAEKCKTRRNFVLKLMRDQGVINEAQYDQAVSEPLPEKPYETDDGAGSYLSLVFEELSGIFPSAGTSALHSIRVYTALDSALQTTLESIEAETDASYLVRGNETNVIKAFYSAIGSSPRLPASTIKPLLVYAPALEENYVSPATPVLDCEVNFGGYSPKNYKGTYEGYVSVRYALSRSVNIPAVKILNEIGIDRACSYLEKMNMTIPDEDRSLALALGGMKEGFSLCALADGYSVFARGGYFSPARTILRVEDEKGNMLYEYKPASSRVFSEDVACLVSDMLKTAVEEGTAKTLKALPFPVCAKTGTGANGEGNTDAYTIGYTAEDTVAVWLGNADYSPVKTTGGALPAQYALSIFRALYKNRTPAPFPAYTGVREVSIDKEAYESEHRILIADPCAPPITSIRELFRSSALPAETSSRFSSPVVLPPKLSVQNGSVVIELQKAEYYDFVIKRKNNGEEITVYNGKYRPQICDNSVEGGKTYEYSVTAVYCGNAGEPLRLPSVKIPRSNGVPDDWWE